MSKTLSLSELQYTIKTAVASVVPFDNVRMVTDQVVGILLYNISKVTDKLDIGTATILLQSIAGFAAVLDTVQRQNALSAEFVDSPNTIP